MRAVSTAASGARHFSELALQALLVVGIAAALLLALSPTFGPAEDVLGIDGANARDNVSITVPDGTFARATTATLSPGAVWAYAQCFQGGRLVYAQYVDVGAGNTATFILGPTPLWWAGSANCTAEAGSWGRNGRWHAVASTTFDVSD